MEVVYNFLTVGNIIAVITAVIFVHFQLKYFSKTKKYRTLYADFFRKQSEYSKTLISIEQDNYPQLVEVGMSYSDLNELIKEINKCSE